MNTASKFIAFTLLICGLIAVTFLSKLIPGQLDLTDSDFYTLSDGSKTLLKDIEEPIKLEFYFSRSAKDIPIMFKNYATRIEELLRQYRRAGGSNLKLTIIDPKPDTKEEESAIRYGINGQPLPNGDKLYFGLAIVQADQEEKIPFFTFDRERFLEYDISRIIHKVQQFDLPTLGVISSLDVIGEKDQSMPMMPGQPPAAPEDWAFITELRNSFKIEKVNIEEGNIKEKFSVLAVIHPQSLDDATLFEIDQFLLSGKPVFIAVDPSSYFQKSSLGQAAMFGQTPVSSDLPKLFKSWGVEFDSGKVVGDKNYAANVSQGGAGIRYAAWLRLDVEALNDASPPTAQLKDILMAEAGSIGVTEDSGLELTTLASSSEKSGTLTANILNFTQPDDLMGQITTDGDKRVLAGFIRGEFKTAFPDGKPIVETEDKGEENFVEKKPEKPNPVPGIKEGNGNLFLIADTDLMADSFSIRKLNFFGQTAIQTINDNLSFVINVMEYLGGSEDLLAIRGKGSSIRPFKIVKDIRQKAQEEFQQEYEDINEKLTNITNKIRKIQNEEKDKGNLVASSKLREALENMRKEEADFKGQRREIKKKLREDVERLDRKLALINLFSMPSLITIFGIWFFVFRTKRQKKK